jgi:hypothetical protein
MASVKEAVNFVWGAAISDQTRIPVADDGSKVQNRTITQAHFTHAMIEVNPSSSASSHSELRRWHDEFGSKKTVGESTPKPQTYQLPWERTNKLGGTSGYKERVDIDGRVASNPGHAARYSWLRANANENASGESGMGVLA